MPRNDPTDTGGLFIGRRPGTAPLKFRAAPERATGRRRRVDAALANLLLAIEFLVVLSCWGPQPLGAFWLGARIDYWTGSLFIGITCAFFVLLATLMATLWIASRLDGVWRILRRAAGHDQKEGVLGRLFMWTAIVAGGGFVFWFVIIHGPGSMLLPGQQ
jgi:hypothetical protein